MKRISAIILLATASLCATASAHGDAGSARGGIDARATIHAPGDAITARETIAAIPASRPLAIGQLQYEGGGDWYANPSGLPNLMRHITQKLGVQMADRPVQLRLTDATLWTVPYLYMTGHGNVRFSEEEVRILRRYLDQGGFLHADDNYGMDESFRREIRRVFPDAVLMEVPHDHPVYHTVYDFPRGLPKVHRHDDKPAQGLGIFRNGRLVVYYSFQSDLGNGWEDAERYGNPPELREAALGMGVNLFAYALSQVTQ